MISSFFSKNFIKLNEVDSTNNFLIKLNKTKRFSETIVVTADYQTNGKGRRGKSWESKYGKNLLVSILINHDLNIEDQFKFSALISLSLRELISFYLDEEVFVKWPNDIIVDNRKIAGCIIENIVVEQKIKTSVIGIGININQLKFKKYVPEATSLAKIKNCEFDINQIKNKLLQLIEEFYLKIDDDIVKVYNKYLFKKNKSFDFMINEKKDKGVIVSVNNQGELLIRKNKKVKKVKVNQIKYLF